MNYRCAGLIYGPETHHIDHLAPLCQLMQIPLVVTEEEVSLLASRYYPSLEVIFVDYLGAAEHIVTHYDVMFYSIPRDLFDEVFFFAQKLAQKKVHTVWVPHGNSDKGNAITYMEALRKEEIALVYGKQMIEFLIKKHAFDNLRAHVTTGNYRYEFYLKHKEHYDRLASQEILRKLPTGRKNILYAPTWQDYENSSSFFDAAPHLLEHLPDHYNLILKLHPNLFVQHDIKVDLLLEPYTGRPNLLILPPFPPIYPLLNICDLYIGDRSSIGYDFLAFDRPMFFLNPDESDYLVRCGVEIKKEQYPQIYTLIDNYFHFELRSFSELKKEVYAYAFGHRKPLETLKKEIAHSLTALPESDLNFF